MQKGLMFPDELFKINDQKIYNSRVQFGTDLAKHQKIMFCGICRNVGTKLERNLLRIGETAKYFKDYSILIYENDSTDDTVDILRRYESRKLSFFTETRADKNYNDLLESGQDPVHYNRCQVLASCRNFYLDFAQKSDADIICVLDLDLWGGWSYDGFLNSVGVLYGKPTNGAVTAYGVLTDCYNHYSLEDIDPKMYIMYDCFVYRPLGPDVAQPKFGTAQYNFIRKNPGDTPIFVNSNFNGMGIYKREALLGVQYGVKLWDQDSVDADHVVLHRQMRDNGWGVIFNPSMLVSYADHQYSKTPLVGE